MTLTNTSPTDIDDGAERPPGPPRPSVARRLGLDRFSGAYALALVVILFGAWLPETFLTSTSLRTISANQAVTAIVAMALIIPLAAGLYDLSVAAVLAMAVVLPLQLQEQGFGLVLSIGLTLAAGLLVGAINGLLVVWLEINSFIATLGMSSVLAAVAYWITDGNQLVAGEDSADFVSLGQGGLLGITYPVWYALVIAAVLYYITEMTTVGRYLHAIGGNIEASRLVGIRVDRVQFGAMMCSGLLAAVAGLVLAAQLGSGSADIGGSYLLPAFSAVLLGATQIKTNGRVNVLGTLLAVVLLATGIYGLQLAGAPSFISSLFNGLALILAVALSIQANRRA